MENRSFDHFLGWLPGADGRQAGLSFPGTNGYPSNTFALAPDFQGAGYADPRHDYLAAQVCYNRGLCNGWLQGNPDAFALGYYRGTNLPFLGKVATNWTVCDRYFAAILAETQPNRIYLHAAQTPFLTEVPNQGFVDLVIPTIWDRLLSNNISCAYYHAGWLHTLRLWGEGRYAGITHYVKPDFYDACTSGNLPAVSIVDPEFTEPHLGNGNDDHPPANILDGEAFLADIYNRVVSSPAWTNTVLIITFDEWGGFFDHIPPPKLEPAEVPFLDQFAYATAQFPVPPGDPTYGLRGFRVPCIVVSPWSRGAHVESGTYDHTSILRLIEERWGLQPLTQRDQNANSLARVLDFQHPDFSAVPTINAANQTYASRFRVDWTPTVSLPGIIWNPYHQALQIAPSLDGPWSLATTNNPPFVPVANQPEQFFRTSWIP